MKCGCIWCKGFSKGISNFTPKMLDHDFVLEEQLGIHSACRRDEYSFPLSSIEDSSRCAHQSPVKLHLPGPKHRC